MRLEVVSAFAMGIVLPLIAACLEYTRQGLTLSWVDIRGDLQDYVAAALLLIAGWFAVRVHSLAPTFLVLAWSYFTSMMFDSSWAEIDDTLRGEIERFNSTVIAGKVAFLAIGLICLVIAVRRATTTQLLAD